MVIVQSWSGKSGLYIQYLRYLEFSKHVDQSFLVSSYIMAIKYIFYAQAFRVRRPVLGKNICLLAQ